MSYLLRYKKYRLPLRVPLRTARGVWGEREGLLLRLEDETGGVGYGEIAPIPWFGTETMDEAEEICRALGERPSEAELASVPAALGCVRFGLETARTPVGIGGGQRLSVAALLPAGRAALLELPAKLEAGYLAFKWKVGVGAPEDELALLDDLCAMLPGYAKLRLDANGGWSRRQAAKWLDRCADRPVELVEQPLEPRDEDGLLGLAHDFPVTLALDESVLHLDAARRWQGRGWPGVFVIKPALAGPLPEIEAWALETKAELVLSSAIETVVGRRAIVRWALASGLTARPLGFGVDGVFADDRWNGPLLGAIADGHWAGATDEEALWTALN